MHGVGAKLNTADLHDELVAALLAAGGVEPEALLPLAYTGKRVDVVFPTPRILVEVKSLVEDQIAINSISRRVNPIFQKWAKLGGPIPFGTVQIPWGKMPAKMQHEMEAALAPRIEQNLKDANKQFRETKLALGWGTTFNVLAIIAPNTFQLDPSVIGRVAWNQLLRRTDNLPEIDCVMAITAQVLDQPRSVTLPMAVINMPRRDKLPATAAGGFIGCAWVRHFTAKTGVEVVGYEPSDEAFFEQFGLVEIEEPRVGE